MADRGLQRARPRGSRAAGAIRRGGAQAGAPDRGTHRPCARQRDREARQGSRPQRPVAEAYGVALPDGPRRVEGGVSFAGTGAGQWIAAPSRARPLRRTRARAHRRACFDFRPDRRAPRAASARRPRARRAGQGRAARPAPEVLQARRRRNHAGRLCRRADRPARRQPTFQLTAPRSMAGSFWSWLASAAEFGYDVVPRASAGR